MTAGCRAAARARFTRAWLLLSTLLAGCASAPDRFYTLNFAASATGAATPVGGASHATQTVRLAVIVPALVDRNELVMLTGANGVSIFEHERWAAPLAGQVQQILGRDLEARRADLLIGDRAVAGVATITLTVDLVRMEARHGAPAVIEAQWRIHDPSAGADRLGAAVFSASGRVATADEMAAAYSADLGLLADRLAQEISRR